MLEELGAIQSRISEIQARIAALSPPKPPAAEPPDAAPAAPQEVFDATLQRAAAAGSAPRRAFLHRSSESASGITVTPASLGPLPPMPIDPSTVHMIPLQQSGTRQFEDLIQTYADKHQIDPALVRAVIRTESGGNPRAVSTAGAMGLMQLMPSNVKEAGISDAFDPEQNIAAGTKQLSGLLKEYGGDLDLALAGYNAGPGNVRKFGGVPPFRETQDYIRKVRAAMGTDGP